MIDLSINISTYNNIDFLHVCLDSIFKKIVGINIEVIVVDNASTDGTAKMVSNEFPHVILLENSYNKGVAPSRNQSIKISRGRYILILDADTSILSDNFSDLLHYMDSNNDVALLGVTQLNVDKHFYPAARTFPKIKHVILRRLSFLSFIRNSKIMNAHHLFNVRPETPIHVDYVIGAFQLVNRRHMEKIGVLDEKMFYGFEDADYCARVKKSGFKVIYYPMFEIKHYVQGLTRNKRLMSTRGLKLLLNHFKSYIRFYIKHRDLINI